MKKQVFLFTVLFVAVIFAVAFAEKPNKPPVTHVDKNRNGVVDKKEIKMERSEVNTPAERIADTDKDGIVEKTEASTWQQLHKSGVDLNNDGIVDAKEKRTLWKNSRAKVNKPIEAKYDANGNGWLEPVEAKELLRDKQELVKTNGKAKVDTVLEAPYDINGDGIIDANEAKAMKEDLQ